ncbi:MAG: hypothetical protein RR012_05600 [Oscillospiraceae bacterium]
MGENKILKIGILAAATAATAAGSIMFADKNLKNLVKGMANSEPTKIRKPVADDEILKSVTESVVREPASETVDILPQIDLNDVAAVIDSVAIEQVIPEVKPLVQETAACENNIVVEPLPILNQEIEMQEQAIVAQPEVELPQAIISEVPQNATDDEYDDIMPSLPYIAGKLETLYDENKITQPDHSSSNAAEIAGIPQPKLIFKERDIPVEINNDTAVSEAVAEPEVIEQVTVQEVVKESSKNPFLSVDIEAPEPIAEPEVVPEVVPEVIPEVIPEVEAQVSGQAQQSSTNPFFSLTFEEPEVILPPQDQISVSNPTTDIPVVAYVAEENEVKVEEQPSPIVVSGPYLDEQIQLPEEPSIEEVEDSIELPVAEEIAKPQLEFGEPILSNPVEVGNTVVIGNSIVSDDPNNKAIGLVALSFPGIFRDRLVSIIAQDESGIVFEFSNNRTRSENTLLNVYSITAEGEVFLPREEERTAALEFGKAFITDMPELGDFLMN